MKYGSLMYWSVGACNMGCGTWGRRSLGCLKMTKMSMGAYIMGFGVWVWVWVCDIGCEGVSECLKITKKVPQFDILARKFKVQVT